MTVILIVYTCKVETLENENRISSEDAKIDQFLIQALNCDNNPNCSSSVFNGANQITNLLSFDDSFVDADIKQTLIQKSDGENRDGFIMQNLGLQGFQISASDDSKVDADNSGDNVKMKMKQKIIIDVTIQVALILEIKSML